MKRLYQLAALVLLASPAVAFAQSCTTINTVPAGITTPGKYCLAKDFTLNLTSGVAIGIGANDVTIDCDGHTLKNITTVATNTSVAIKSIGRNNIVIQNCRVIGGWMNGIDLEQNNSADRNSNFYLNIRDNYVAGPFWHGIKVWGSAIEVRGNQVYDVGRRPNTYAAGIRVGGALASSHHQVVRDNTIVGTNTNYGAAFGIFSDASVGSVFFNNGIMATQSKDGVVGYGLYVIGSWNRISDNHVTGVGLPGEVGIWTKDGSTTCFDNYLRAEGSTTVNCDAGVGNL